MAIKAVCDFCERPLPLETTETFHGPMEYIKNSYTHEVNTRKLFPHLCESCALKIDEAVSLAKIEWLKQIDISDRNIRINALRREVLGTKG